MTRLLPLLRACLVAFLGLALLTGWLVASARPAAADGCGSDEQGFVSSGPGCRKTAIIYPHDRLLTRDDLLRDLPLYEHYGFDRDFILTAPQTTLTVEEGLTWSGCDDNGGDVCDVGVEAVHLRPMTYIFPVGMPFTVIGTKDKWIALMCGNFHPVSGPGTDVAKVGFELVDPPSRIEADTDTTLTVRADLQSSGPKSPTRVVDLIEAHVPEDCRVDQPVARNEVELIAGVRTSVYGRFVVNCADPSFHPFTFTDVLQSETGVFDPDLGNNRASTSVTIPVFDRSDVAVSDPALDCAADTKVGTEFVCTGRATLSNRGPYSPVRTDAGLALSGPDDCRVTPASGSDLSDEPIAVDAAVELRRAWTVRCADRSFHPMRLTARAAVDHLHVEDPNSDNDQAEAGDVVEVFEDVDLAARVTDVRCSERESNLSSSRCVATVEVVNHGPASHVRTETDVTFAPEAGCRVDPAGSQTTALTLDAGERATVTAAVDLLCSTPRRHSIGVTAVLHNAPSDPHAVDSDRASAGWVPSDTKPRSLPSSINVSKQGLIPFAVLATAEFDPLTQLDIASLRYGVTGTEDSIVRCQAGGEDVNDDGRADLVCQADTQATGVSLSTTVMVVRGLRTDGTPLVSQDDVKVVGR